ncbi:MAG: hypothetical protein ACI9K3_000508, partial [Halovenus sp.]
MCNASYRTLAVLDESMTVAAERIERLHELAHEAAR